MMFCLQMCAFTMGALTSREKYGMMGVPTPVNALTALKENTSAKKGTVFYGKWLAVSGNWSCKKKKRDCLAIAIFSETSDLCLCNVCSG